MKSGEKKSLIGNIPCRRSIESLGEGGKVRKRSEGKAYYKLYGRYSKKRNESRERVASPGRGGEKGDWMCLRRKRTRRSKTFTWRPWAPGGREKKQSERKGFEGGRLATLQQKKY